MTPRERFLTALTNRIPDRVPAAPDMSNYIPCKRTGLPFWEIYFEDRIPLWKAYLDNVAYFGAEAWVASCTGPSVICEDSPVETHAWNVYDADRDTMTRHTTIHTPDGDLTTAEVCFRQEPPSPAEKAMKSLVCDWPKFRHIASRMPRAIDHASMEEVRAACYAKDQAFGVCVSYPGFHMWQCFVEGSVAQLSYALSDASEILDEWFELDMETGTRLMDLLIAERPDYILLGGSGTVTMASPQLARRYPLPALKLWSKMCRDAGIPTCLHSCGKSRVLVEMLANETDVDSINPLEIKPMGDIDLAEVKARFGDRIGLMGNLHTTEVMLHGTPQTVRAAALRAMADAGPGGGFILSTGDQCGRETPEENIFALVETAKQYGVYAPDGTLPLVAEALKTLTRPH